MGKKIDAFILSLLPGIAVWFYLSKRLESRFVCFAAALLSCVLFGKTMRKMFSLLQRIPVFRKRRLRKNANSAVMRLASIPSEEAHENILALIRKCYPNCTYSLEVIQQHPALKASESAIFQAWRKHIGEERLVICLSCRTDPTIRAFSSGLSAPKVSLIDSDMLAQMIAEFPDGLTDAATPVARLRLRHAITLLVNRKNAPRNILFSLSMLLMYLLTGNYLYLFFALFLLVISFFSMRRKLRPNKLF